MFNNSIESCSILVEMIADVPAEEAAESSDDVNLPNTPMVV